MGPGIDRLIKTASYQVINAWPHGPLDLAKLIAVVAKVLKIKKMMYAQEISKRTMSGRVAYSAIGPFANWG